MDILHYLWYSNFVGWVIRNKMSKRAPWKDNNEQKKYGETLV